MEMSLSINDVNGIIRIFSFTIQLRIQELNYNPSFSNMYPSVEEQNNEEKQIEIASICSKYANYITAAQKQIALLQKLVKRVLEIYRFFKGKSNNQNLLTSIENKISNECESIVNEVPLNVGKLFSYIHLIIKKGCIIKVPAQKRRTYSKTLLKQVSKCCQNNSTVMINNDTNIASPIEGIRTQKIAQHFIYASNIISRRSTSAVNSVKQSTQKLQASSSFVQKKQIEETALQLYKCMDLDTTFFGRFLAGKQNQLQREILRRNQKIHNQVKKYEKGFKRTLIHISNNADFQKINKLDFNRNESSTMLGILTDTKKQNNVVNYSTIKGLMGVRKRKTLLIYKKKNPGLHKENNVTFTQA